MRLAPAALRLLQRRRRTRDGSAAIEFALVGGLFFAALFGTFELAVVFTVDSLLQEATERAGRLVRTGQAASESFKAQQFKAALCEQMSVFSRECESRATVKVEVVQRFDAPPPPPPEVDDLADIYDGGAPGDMMLVTVWYAQPVLLTRFLDQGVSQNGPTALMTASTAFRNEPWGSPAPIQ